MNKIKYIIATFALILSGCSDDDPTPTGAVTVTCDTLAADIAIANATYANDPTTETKANVDCATQAYINFECDTGGNYNADDYSSINCTGDGGGDGGFYYTAPSGTYILISWVNGNSIDCSDGTNGCESNDCSETYLTFTDNSYIFHE